HSRGTVNAWRVWLKSGICVYGGKLKFGGSALLPLNAALVCKRKNSAISQDLVVKAQSLSCRTGFQF
ncbi:hypothetical protein, partial [Vibrio alginolyticus]